MNGKYRKELGQWGEKQIDKWMEQNHWFPIKKNLKIQGGEIDRIYSSTNSTQNRCLCLAEIKTNAIFSEKKLSEIFSEVGIKKYIKPSQIKNLHKYGEKFFLIKNSKIFIRIFIVLKINNKVNKHCLLNIKTSIKICYICHEFLILSIEPEFSTLLSKKSTLEILI